VSFHSFFVQLPLGTMAVTTAFIASVVAANMVGSSEAALRSTSAGESRISAGAVTSTLLYLHWTFSLAQPVARSSKAPPRTTYSSSRTTALRDRSLSFRKKGVDDDDENKKLEELKAEFEPLTKVMKEALGDKIKKVVVSSRLADSPCVFITSELGCSSTRRCSPLALTSMNLPIDDDDVGMLDLRSLRLLRRRTTTTRCMISSAMTRTTMTRTRSWRSSRPSSSHSPSR